MNTATTKGRGGNQEKDDVGQTDELRRRRSSEVLSKQEKGGSRSSSGNGRKREEEQARKLGRDQERQQEEEGGDEEHAGRARQQRNRSEKGSDVKRRGKEANGEEAKEQSSDLNERGEEEEEEEHHLKYESMILKDREDLKVLCIARQELIREQKKAVGEQSQRNKDLLNVTLLAASLFPHTLLSKESHTTLLTLKNTNQLQEQLIRWDAEQTEALQLEDFERAEKLNERIEGCCCCSSFLSSLLTNETKIAAAKEAMSQMDRQKVESSRQILALHLKRAERTREEARLRRAFVERLHSMKVTDPFFSSCKLYPYIHLHSGLC